MIKTGFVFAAAEFGNHFVFQITGLGDNDPDVAMTDSSMGKDQLVTFNPRGHKNIAAVDEIKNMGCITKMECADLLDEGNPQIYLTCGRGALSTLRVVRHGLQVSEIATSPLPDAPTGIWTIKEKYGDDFDKLLVVSFSQSTVVLSIGSKIGEVSDSGFEANTNTIHANLLQDDSVIQIFPAGIIHITPEKKRNKWSCPSGEITCGISNERQVVVAIDSGEIRYFELDMVGTLIEVGSKIMDAEISCIDVGPIQEGRQRSRFLAVGCKGATEDSSILKILSLDPESCLSRISVQALPTFPSSVCLIEMKNNIGVKDMDQTQLFLHIGLNNGVLLRAAVDSITGNLSDSRARYLGTHPISLVKVLVQGMPAMLALQSDPTSETGVGGTSRAWFCYNFMSKYFVAPLSYDPIKYASCFSSEQ